MVDDEKSEPVSLSIKPSLELCEEPGISMKLYMLCEGMNNLISKMDQLTERMEEIEFKQRESFALQSRLTIHLNLDEDGRQNEILNIKTSVVPYFEINDEFQTKCFHAMEVCFLRELDPTFNLDSFQPYHNYTAEEVTMPDIFQLWLDQLVTKPNLTPFSITRGKRFRVFTNEWENCSADIYWNYVCCFLKRGYEAFFLRIQNEWAQMHVTKKSTKFPKFERVDCKALLDLRGPFRKHLHRLRPALSANYIANQA